MTTYHELVIIGSSPDTEIWLGDDAGHFVAKGAGKLEEKLLAGDYVVEFGLGTASCPIRLRQNAGFTQDAITAGDSCARPKVRFPEQSD